MTIRLIALDTLRDDRLVKKWLLPAAGQGITYVHADLLWVAADEPIIEGPEGQPAFALASFSRRLAEAAVSSGRA